MAVSLVDGGVSGYKIKEFSVVYIVKIYPLSSINHNWVRLVVVATVFLFHAKYLIDVTPLIIGCGKRFR
jgi:hypothetical protein